MHTNNFVKICIMLAHKTLLYRLFVSRILVIVFFVTFLNVQ